MNVKELIRQVVEGTEPQEILEAKKFKVGDLVKMTAKWLKSTGSTSGNKTGKITKVEKMGSLELYTIDWGTGETKAIGVNLQLKGRADRSGM